MGAPAARIYHRVMIVTVGGSSVGRALAALSAIDGSQRVRIRAFGPLRIVADGQPLRFGRKSPFVLLRLLKVLVAIAEPISVAQLSAAIWPGYGESPPRGTLDTALYRLRRLLGVEGAIESAAGYVSLCTSTCWTDTRALARCCDLILSLGGSAFGEASVDELARCQLTLLDLYRGALGVEDDPAPVARARRCLDRRFARACGELERLWTRLGQAQRRDELILATSEGEVPYGPVRVAAFADPRNELD
jgi:DNA-binding SARP family transcriptional activator